MEHLKGGAIPLGNRKQMVSLGLTFVLCVGGGVFLYRTGFFEACTSLAALQDYIARSAPYSHLAFFLVQFLSVVLAPIPSNISAAAGGVLFGTWTAFLLTFSAVMAGSVLVFWLARTLGGSFADAFVSRRVSQRYQDLIHSRATTFLILAFLLPYFPDDILCILAGLTDLSLRRFVLIALCTRPWGLLFASALGGASLSIPLWGLVLLGLGGIALFAAGMIWGDRAEQAVLRVLRRKKEP